MYSIYIPSRTL